MNKEIRKCILQYNIGFDNIKIKPLCEGLLFFVFFIFNPGLKTERNFFELACIMK